MTELEKLEQSLKAVERERLIEYFLGKFGRTLINRSELAELLMKTEAYVKEKCRNEKWDLIPKPNAGGRGVVYEWNIYDVVDFLLRDQ